MATFVLVHGAIVGGWCWRWVATTLRGAGHDVYTPTMTGLGERVHLATPDVDLDIHIEDIPNVLRFEDLTEVVLVGWSCGGMVVAGVADRARRLPRCRCPKRRRHESPSEPPRRPQGTGACLRRLARPARHRREHDSPGRCLGDLDGVAGRHAFLDRGADRSAPAQDLDPADPSDGRGLRDPDDLHPLHDRLRPDRRRHPAPGHPYPQRTNLALPRAGREPSLPMEGSECGCRPAPRLVVDINVTEEYPVRACWLAMAGIVVSGAVLSTLGYSRRFSAETLSQSPAVSLRRQ